MQVGLHGEQCRGAARGEQGDVPAPSALPVRGEGEGAQEKAGEGQQGEASSSLALLTGRR